MINRLVQHTKINIISYILGAIVIYFVSTYITDPANIPRSRMSDSWGSDIGAAMGAIVIAGFIKLAALIFWSTRVIWIIIRFFGLKFLIILNIAILPLGWFPFYNTIAEGIAFNYWNYINKIKKDEVVVSTVKYHTINFPTGLNLLSHVETGDSVILALKQVNYGNDDNRPPAKYYLLKGDILVEIPKSIIKNLLVNNGNHHSQEWFSNTFEDFRDAKINNYSYNVKIEINDKPPYHVYLTDSLTGKKIDSLIGFKFDPYNKTNTYINPSSQSIYLPFSTHEYDSDSRLQIYNENYFIAVKNLNKKIKVMKVDLSDIESVDRQFSKPKVINLIRNDTLFFFRSNKIHYLVTKIGK